MVAHLVYDTIRTSRGTMMIIEAAGWYYFTTPRYGVEIGPYYDLDDCRREARKHAAMSIPD